MRVKLIKNIRPAGLPQVLMLAGSTVETTFETATKWITQGYAVPDRPKAETATIQPKEKAIKRKK